SRDWQWDDFDNDLRVTIDQSWFTTGHRVYYDAIGLRVTTADPNQQATPTPAPTNTPTLTPTPTVTSTPPATPTHATTASPTPPPNTPAPTDPPAPTNTPTNSPTPSPTPVVLPMAQPGAPLDTSRLVNVYNQAVRAPDVWNEAPDYIQGQGVT